MLADLEEKESRADGGRKGSRLEVTAGDNEVRGAVQLKHGGRGGHCS